MPYPPTIYVNGVRLTNVTVHESREISGVYVSSVHIEAPDFELRRKDDE